MTQYVLLDSNNTTLQEDIVYISEKHQQQYDPSSFWTLPSDQTIWKIPDPSDDEKKALKMVTWKE